MPAVQSRLAPSDSIGNRPPKQRKRKTRGRDILRNIYIYIYIYVNSYVLRERGRERVREKREKEREREGKGHTTIRQREDIIHPVTTREGRRQPINRKGYT